MKNLILIIFLFVSLSSQSQDKTKPDSTYKVSNSNGSYTIVEKWGDKTTSSTRFSYVNNGKTTTITNPDGTQSIVVNDINTGSIFAADGTLSTTLSVVTASEAKVMEASFPKKLYVSHTDRSATIGLKVFSSKSASTYSSLSTTTNTGTGQKR